jgi:Uma2 family endonuclease
MILAEDSATYTVPTEPLVLHMWPAVEMTDDQLLEFCAINGDLIIMSPASGSTGARNAVLVIQLSNCALENDTGIIFDFSTGFKLPNGATRAPDAAWVRNERLADLAEEQRERFLPLCPDFAIELCSPSRPIDYGSGKNGRAHRQRPAAWMAY